MQKVGRNNPCPCGSGKKFKKCCLSALGKDYKTEKSAYTSNKYSFEDYAQQHETGHLLSMVTSLQLLPSNHSKNVRIEEIAKLVVKNLSSGELEDINKMKYLINKDFATHHMEDLPEQLFTENVLFHGGNYVVMPGINSDCVEVFSYLSQAIFNISNDLKPDQKKILNDGIMFMLMFGDIMFTQSGLSRNIYEEDFRNNLNFPEEFTDHKFSQKELDKLCHRLDIDRKIIDEFILDEFPENLDDPNFSPILFKPLVKFQDNIHFVLPSCQMLAINEFIAQKLIAFNSTTEIHKTVHILIWRRIWSACKIMDWHRIKVDLPTCELSNIKEGIFSMTHGMLAYVCYVFPTDVKPYSAGFENIMPLSKRISNLNTRIKQVIEHLKNVEEFNGHRFLSLVLLNTMGASSAYSFNESSEDEERIIFEAFDFLSLIKLEKWGALDLYKFAKVYAKRSSNSGLICTSTIDAYAMYKKGDSSFYMEDDTNPDVLFIVPGTGYDLIFKAKQKLDKHGVSSFVEDREVLRSVERFREYENVYCLETPTRSYELLVNSFSIPLWVQNFQSNSELQKNLTEHIVEAVCYWLDKCAARLSSLFINCDLKVLNLELEFDDTFFNDLPIQKMTTEILKELDLHASYQSNTLNLKFPSHFHSLFTGGDNAGERELIRALLVSLNHVPDVVITNDEVVSIINDCMPLSAAKMILLSHSGNDIRIDKSWLPPSFFLSQAEINLLLDRLAGIISPEVTIPEKIENKSDKKVLCNKAVLRLLQDLLDKVQPYHHTDLIRILLYINERQVFLREYGKMKTSAQILCFGQNDEKFQEILDRQSSMVKTSLAVRCFIELLVQYPSTGNQSVNYDILDELLVQMHEIINFGMLSDTIHYELDDPEIGLLQSGRVGISKTFFDEKLKPFFVDRTSSHLDAHLEHFSTHFEVKDFSNLEETADELIDHIDDAFIADQKFAYSNAIGVCYHLSSMAFNKKNSVVSMSLNELIAELKGVMTGAESEVEKIIDFLSLIRHTGKVTYNEGYIYRDYYPWAYNRPASFALRPIVILEEEGNQNCYWGMRHCIAASSFLIELLHSGRLTGVGKNINKLLGKFREENGKEFREEVLSWLKANTDLNVYDYEVTIKERGHLKANKDYGDCDILAVNTTENVVFNIECKSTGAARNIAQMKTELDAYFGRYGQKKKLVKHEERDTWLKNNIEQLQQFIGFEQVIKVRSVVLTSELLPTRYIKSDYTRLPIISFQELKTIGIEVFDQNFK
ncbi:MAG: SEC-C metal-binding domain-containing protein [Nonlabens sp.]